MTLDPKAPADPRPGPFHAGRPDRRVLILAGLSMLAGCATSPVRLAPPDHALLELEPVYAVRSDVFGLTVQVGTSGCTRRQDFRTFLERQGGTARLAIGRLRLDRCGHPARARIRFSYGELGVRPGEPVVLLNPSGAGP